MATSLSNFVINLKEGIHKTKCKDCDRFLEYESIKDNLIKYKCLSFNNDYSKKNYGELIKQINTFKISNNDINKSILLFKGFFLYGYIDDWENFNETSLPEEE